MSYLAEKRYVACTALNARTSPRPCPLYCPCPRLRPHLPPTLSPPQALTEQHKSLQLRYVTLQMKAQAS